MFGVHGEIGDIYMPRNHQTKQPRGFAFVRFKDRQAAEDAIKEFDQKEIRGRAVACRFAEKPRPDNPRDLYKDKGGGRRWRRTRRWIPGRRRVLRWIVLRQAAVGRRRSILP